ncbi:MAG TPA: hypothetical protein ENJ00_09775 [Phycisphaerales bacterium]|nr:hypothetical protein [Phycisphaerales bacterium]
MNNSIPEIDYDDPKELWAFFGLASYYAQVLEQGLVNLVVAIRVMDSNAMKAGTIEDLFNKESWNTFGQLLKNAKRLVDISDELSVELEEALGKRNYLAHRFFVGHDVDIRSEHGRRGMIEELRSILILLKSVDIKLDLLWQTAFEKLGITQAVRDQGFHDMQVES